MTNLNYEIIAILVIFGLLILGIAVLMSIKKDGWKHTLLILGYGAAFTGIYTLIAKLLHK